MYSIIKVEYTNEFNTNLTQKHNVVLPPYITHLRLDFADPAIKELPNTLTHFIINFVQYFAFFKLSKLSNLRYFAYVGCGHFKITHLPPQLTHLECPVLQSGRTQQVCLLGW